MVKVLIALCLVAAVQVCAAYEFAVPVFRQPYGKGEERIVGGETAKRGQFPHQAAVYLDGSSFCGGSLIAKNWVLTAGHCVNGFSSWSVILGAQNIRDSNEPGRVTVDTKNGVRHENYDGSTITNDVAVIGLPKDVEFTEYINVIALPPRSWKDENLAGKLARVSGWGRTSDSTGGISPTLQFVDLPLITLEECRRIYGSNVITNTKYCCSGANQKSTCNGDSGGSLTLGSGKDLKNLGIVSFGSSAGCAKGYPVGFTATPHFVDWISEKTGIPVTP